MNLTQRQTPFLTQVWKEASTIFHDDSSDCVHHSTDILPKLGGFHPPFLLCGGRRILQLYYWICVRYALYEVF